MGQNTKGFSLGPFPCLNIEAAILANSLSVPVAGEGDGGRPGDLRGGTVPRGELRVPRLEHDVPERGAPLLLALRVINPIV